MLENVLMVPLALAIDLFIGEYPNKLHPVNWIGHVISLLLKTAPKKWMTLQFLYGTFAVLFTMALFAVPVWFLMEFLQDFSVIAYVIVGALLLKSTFSLKALYKVAMNVKNLLDKRKLNEARKETGYLVSRDTTKLSRGEIVSAIIEMISESVTDSAVAPLFWWVFFGVPGALAFRVVNTWDSRIGYRGQYEYLGKFAARLDDVLNFIPARFAAILMVLSAFLLRQNGRKAMKAAFRYHGKTSSPNAGWTMSAAAGALDTRLEKPGHYRLGEAEEFPEPSLIPAGLRLVMLSCFLWFGICVAATGVYYAVIA